MRRSNCLVVALIVAQRTGGRVQWRPMHIDGWRWCTKHPWGHFYVELPSGRVLHYTPIEDDLPWWRQLWFEGRLLRETA